MSVWTHWQGLGLYGCPVLLVITIRSRMDEQQAAVAGMDNVTGDKPAHSSAAYLETRVDTQKHLLGRGGILGGNPRTGMRDCWLIIWLLGVILINGTGHRLCHSAARWLRVIVHSTLTPHWNWERRYP